MYGRVQHKVPGGVTGLVIDLMALLLVRKCEGTMDVRRKGMMD